MKTEIKINVRTYGVVIEDNRTGEVSFDSIVLDKQRVQAAQILGMSDVNIIRNIYNRNGFNVQDIRFSHKTEIPVDLGELVAGEEQSIDWKELADSCTEGAELALEYWKMEEQMEKLQEEARELLRDQARRNVDELTEDDNCGY